EARLRLQLRRSMPRLARLPPTLSSKRHAMNKRIGNQPDTSRLAEALRLTAWSLVGLGMALALASGFFFVLGRDRVAKRDSQPPTFTNSEDRPRQVLWLPPPVEPPAPSADVAANALLEDIGAAEAPEAFSDSLDESADLIETRIQ